MMVLARHNRETQLDPVLEVRLWRDATTIYMMSGPGGCEPFGLAVAAHERGLKASIIVSIEDMLFLQSVRSEEKRKVMQLAQTDFRQRTEAYAIPVDYRGFTLHDILAALRRGAAVIVLISGYHMFGKKVPHWVLAHGEDGRHILIHDPGWRKNSAKPLPMLQMSLFPSTFSTASHGSAVMGSGRPLFWKKDGLMTICVILVGRLSDIDNGATPHKVMTTRDYLAHPALFNGQLRPRIINLSRSYAYQSRGYYASLLAEARGIASSLCGNDDRSVGTATL